jgi:hypothetical protein
MAPTDNREIYLMDRFRLKPDVKEAVFVEYKNQFRDTLKSDYEWDLVAGGNRGLKVAGYNFWQLPNANGLRIAMEGLSDESFFHSMVDSMEEEEGTLLVPLTYDPHGPQGPPPEDRASLAARATAPGAYYYLLETFSLVGDGSATFKQRFMGPVYWLKEVLQQRGFRLLVAAVRITGDPGSLVHLWKVPEGTEALDVLGDLRADDLYGALESCRTDYQVEVLTRSAWDR